MIEYFSKFIILLAALGLLQSCAAGPKADMVLVNGKILTVDDLFSTAEAVAITDGRIIAVGRNDETEEYRGNNTEVIDLAGKTVVPGFIDGHAHMDREGLKYLPTSLDGIRSIDGILEVIKRKVEGKKPGEWIVTMPMGDYPYYGVRADYLIDDRFPNRHDLDKVAPDNPVYIKSPWYYWTGIEPIVSVVNSAALELAGITNETVTPHPGMIIEKDSNGEPTGIITENGPIGSVEHSLLKVVPRFSANDRLAALRKSIALYNSEGVTSVYEGHGIAPEILDAYKKLHQQGELTVRSYLVLSPTWDKNPEAPLSEMLEQWAGVAGGRGMGDEFLKLGGIYAEVGGTPQDYVRRGDSDYSGWGGQSVDAALAPARGSLEDLINSAAAADLRVNAITYSGDSLSEHIAAFELAAKVGPIKEKRFVIEHLSFVSEENIAKIKAFDLIPTVLPGSMVWLNGLGRTKDLSPELANTYVPLQTFVENDIPFSIGSDNVPYAPLHSIGAAVTRLDAATGEVSSPDQKISREEALRAATIYGAYLSFEEEQKGSIEVGKLADLAVLSDDYMAVKPEDIRHIQVLMTMVGGKVVYEK